ncbi:MAG: carboxypeptidase regulatory-like domain-containing protein [Acidobacteria bacterium]|nr:carboxypeptidase regulatory-like domain-containing protein [Acidobacteriota bacterium]
MIVFSQSNAFINEAAKFRRFGRVSSAKGRGVTRARVYLTDQQGETRYAMTNSFGYFRFDDVPAGETYIVNVFSKSYQFSSQVVTVTEEITELNFLPQ